MGLLWFIVIALVLFWFAGYFVFYLGNIVHVLIFIAIVVLIYNVSKKKEG